MNHWQNVSYNKMKPKNNHKMSAFKLLILICILLVNTHSSPISEPPEDKDRSLPETNFENIENENKVKQLEVLITETAETSTGEDLLYCNQFDNSCTKCVKSENCSFAIDLEQVQTELCWQCF